MRKAIFLFVVLIMLTGISSATAFNSTWKTDNAGTSNDDQITLPLESTGTYNFVVDWGDESQDTITAYNQAEVTHTYASAGTYNVSITGTIDGFRFNNGGDRLKIIDVSQWGDLRVGNSGSYFYGCSNMYTSATDSLNTSSVTNMYAMFYGCSVANPDVSGFDTSSVTNMYAMFYGCSVANPDVSGFDTSSVTNMGYMFYGCSVANPDVSGFDTSSVTDMGYMFYGCSVANPDVSGFDTSSVTNMYAMFSGCSVANPDVSGFDTSSVTDMGYMFYGCSVANPDVSGFDTSSVTNMGYMFTNANTWTEENYNKALLSWGALSVQSGVTFDAGTRKIYTGLPETRKASLVSQGWTITDGGNTTGTGYFGLAVSADGGVTWTPVTNNTMTLYNVTGTDLIFRSTSDVYADDFEASVYFTEDTTLISESEDTDNVYVNISHTAENNATSGYLKYTPTTSNFTYNLSMASSDPNATAITHNQIINVSTGEHSSGDSFYYNFTLSTLESFEYTVNWISKSATKAVVEYNSSNSNVENDFYLENMSASSTFDFKYSNGTILANATSDSNGYLKFDDVRPMVNGTYTIETQAEKFPVPTFVAVTSGFVAVVFAIASFINQRRKRW